MPRPKNLNPEKKIERGRVVSIKLNDMDNERWEAWAKKTGHKGVPQAVRHTVEKTISDPSKREPRFAGAPIDSPVIIFKCKKDYLRCDCKEHRAYREKVLYAGKG